MVTRKKIQPGKSREVSRSVEHPGDEIKRKSKPSIRRKKKSPEKLHNFKKDMKKKKK